MNEEWKPIKDYEMYAVSNFGNIKRLIPSKVKKAGEFLKLNYAANPGYPMICLAKNRTKKTFAVHTLVAQEFIGPRPEGLVINHKDGIKTNPKVDNLEYITHSEDVLHAIRLGNRIPPKGEDVNGAKLKDSDISEILSLRKTGWTISQISERYGITRGAVDLILRGGRWQWLTGLTPDKKTNPYLRGNLKLNIKRGPSALKGKKREKGTLRWILN